MTFSSAMRIVNDGEAAQLDWWWLHLIRLPYRNLVAKTSSNNSHYFT